MRTVFRRYRSTKPSSGSAASIRKDYYFNYVLQFLVPIMKDKKQVGNLPSPPHDAENRGSTDVADTEKFDVDDESVCADEPAESHPQTSGCASQPTVDQLRHKRISMKRKTVSDELDSCMKDYFHSKIHKDGSESSRADEQFLLSLQGDISEMTARQKRQFKKGVYELVDKIMDGHDDSALISSGALASPDSASNILCQGPSAEHSPSLFICNIPDGYQSVFTQHAVCTDVILHLK
ncbi:hypothetical protein PR048_011956 [Dryococelus australis]|uniref:BESS domain-containing protein n=1 Tax=Dryococelus australis TaxID=614101 RepID=A0ABQ9HNS8_9NEOP|nr:hypothetical protein PR048_011956 [Dryococelus australis]